MPALGAAEPEHRHRPRQRYNLLIFLIFALLTGPIFVDPVRYDAPHARGGTIDFAEWGALDRPVQLAGDWRLEWLSGKNAADSLPFDVAVPGPWAGATAPGGTPLPRTAAVRYRLTIVGLKPGVYRLYLGPLHSGSRVYIDGKPVAGYGTFGLSEQSTRELTRAYDIAFEARGGNVDLVYDVAKFRDLGNGTGPPPTLGTANAMQGWFALNWAREFLFDAALVLIGLFSLVIYFNRRADRAALFLGVGTLSFLIPMSVQGFENLWSLALPGTPFGVIQAGIYLGNYAALASWLAYSRALFPRECPAPAYHVLQAALAIPAVAKISCLIAGEPLAASWISRVTLTPLFVIEFALLSWIAVRAIVARRTGAVLFVIGQTTVFASIMMLMLVGFGDLTYDNVLRFDLSSFGILVFLLTHVMILAERWSAAIGAAETLNSDLGQLLEVNSAVTSEARLEILLARIVGVTTRILNAERSTLFLHDVKARQLWSLVAEGLETREIRIGDADGMVGHVFQEGRPAFSADAYGDPRFNREIDASTGFRTRNLIAAPVVARDGRKLGVLQALNNQSASGFSASDEARLLAFAAQAAVAIDNATLFSEVVASRNYNESILRSMSSGVITLDPHALVAKFNAAACAILRVSEEVLAGIDARAWLSTNNPALIAELDAVSATSDLKTLFDFDLVTGDGSHRSVNITIVPLVSEAEEIGLLVLLEDISEGKRLQSAMRRFMPQEVVAQVLGRDDDLMFGTACQASIVFADIRDFTGMAETLSPRETVDMLNEIFTDLFEAVADAGGVLDKYIGDAIMAVFGAPLPTGRDAINAVEAALRMQEMMAAINERRCERGTSALRIGIGIATGEVIAGTVGSPKRMDYTVIGDSVNLASRLEQATKTYRSGILICETTAAAIDGAFVLAEIDRIQVKGRQKLERVFEVKGRA